VIAREQAPAAAADPESLKQQARDAGGAEESVRLGRRALEADSDWNEGRWIVGTALYGLKRFEEARDVFRDFVARERESGAAWALKGLSELQLGEYERALEDLERARSLGVYSRDLEGVARFQLALLLTRFEEYEAALDLFTRIVARGDERPEVVEGMGLSLLRMPLLPSELDPGRSELVMMAGRAAVQWASNRREAARLAFEELLLRHPEEPEVHFAHGLFLQFEDPDAALAEYRRELELSPLHVQARLALAWELLQRQEHGQALPLAEQAVELAPTEAAARNVLGRALLEAGDLDAAILQLEEGARLAPGSPELRFALARAYTRAGRSEDAERERAEFRALSQASEQGAGPQAIGGIDFSIDERDGGGAERN
jgi:tetratricopeptide (TPR) repeat protein